MSVLDAKLTRFGSDNQKSRSLIPRHRALWGRARQEQSRTLTDTVVSAPSGWKLQETVVSALVVSVDLNLHVSFPWVPFATKISFGVYTSKADTPVVNSPRAAVSIGHNQRLRSGAAITAPAPAPAPAPAGAAIVLRCSPAAAAPR